MLWSGNLKRSRPWSPHQSHCGYRGTQPLLERPGQVGMRFRAEMPLTYPLLASHRLTQLVSSQKGSLGTQKYRELRPAPNGCKGNRGARCTTHAVDVPSKYDFSRDNRQHRNVSLLIGPIKDLPD